MLKTVVDNIDLSRFSQIFEKPDAVKTVGNIIVKNIKRTDIDDFDAYSAMGSGDNVAVPLLIFHISGGFEGIVDTEIDPVVEYLEELIDASFLGDDVVVIVLFETAVPGFWVGSAMDTVPVVIYGVAENFIVSACPKHCDSGLVP